MGHWQGLGSIEASARVHVWLKVSGRCPAVGPVVMRQLTAEREWHCNTGSVVRVFLSGPDPRSGRADAVPVLQVARIVSAQLSLYEGYDAFEHGADVARRTEFGLPPDNTNAYVSCRPRKPVTAFAIPSSDVEYLHEVN